MIRSTLSLLAAAVISASFASPARAENLNKPTSSCRDCGSTCQSCDLVDCVVWEKVMVCETRYRNEVTKVEKTIQESYTAFVMKPVTIEVKKKKCYLVDDIAEVEVVRKKCHLVEVPLITEYPEKDIKTCCKGTEKVGPAREEACTIAVGIETIKRNVKYCTKKPVYTEEPCKTITTYELVPVPKTRPVTVCEPVVTKVPFEVQVCKMVPRQIKCCSKCAGNHPKAAKK